MKRTLLQLQVLPGCLWISLIAFAQKPVQPAKEEKTAAPPPAAAQARASEAVVVPSYKYEAKGRRDPFRSLDTVATVQATAAPILRPPGLKGQLVSEISLVGIVKSKNQFLAMATGFRGKTFFIRANDDLYDGKVQEIRSDAVVFNQILIDGQGKKLSQQVVKKLYATRGEGSDAK